MFTSTSRRLLPLALVLAMAIPVSTVNAQARNADEFARVTRVYPVYDLVLPARNYPYPSDHLPSVGDQGVSSVQSYGFGMGGGMGGFGGGGMGGMGGGLFAVPDQMRTPSQTVLSQLGAGGTTNPAGQAAGGGGGYGGRTQGYGGGMGLAGGGEVLSPSVLGNPLHFSMDDLITTITSVVDPESWASVGGPGTIEALGGTLIVANTEAAHEQIEAILDSLRDVGGMHRSIAIEAYWLQLISDQLQSLTQGQSTGLVDPEQLTQVLGTSSLRFQGRITCLNGQTVYVVSGDRHTAITAAIPVVGTEVGYQPSREIPNSGVLLQTTALVLPGGDGALIDVQSTVTEWREATPRRLGMIEIDCPVIAARQLATTVQMKLGTPRLVGGLTVVETKTPAANSGQKEQPQLYLVLRVESPDVVE